MTGASAAVCNEITCEARYLLKLVPILSMLKSQTSEELLSLVLDQLVKVVHSLSKMTLLCHRVYFEREQGPMSSSANPEAVKRPVTNLSRIRVQRLAFSACTAHGDSR